MLARRSDLLLLLLSGGASAGCLNTIEPPPPTAQAQVLFPNRLFLQDEGNASRGFCRGIYEGVPTATNAVGLLDPIDGVTAPPSGPDIPHNCYVEIDTDALAPSLPVDVHEVTNLQFQLCVDSDACRGPDPSNFTKTDVCESEGGFDDCPMVSVSVQEAEDYCEWTGRRLPTGLEAVLIRQAGLALTSTDVPQSLPLFPNDQSEPPTSCEMSVLGNADCGRPFPVMDSSGRVGAAPGDAVEVGMDRGEGVIYDLIGNVAELLRDLASNMRGTADGLPWFCVGDLPERLSNPTQPFDANNPPRCPEGRACVRGFYQPAVDLPMGDYPVCVAPTSGQIGGTRPVVVGGSYFERLVDGNPAGVRDLDARATAGLFAYRVLEGELPDQLNDTQLGRRVGFRCVGQRMSAAGDGDPMDFADQLRLVPRP